MYTSDLLSVFQWWVAFFLIGIIFLPLTKLIFGDFFDQGYLFSKVLGLALVSYALLLLNVLHILPFGLISIILILWILGICNFLLLKKGSKKIRLPKKIIILE